MGRVAVTLNGQRTQVGDGEPLLELLTRLGVEPKRVVVEVNRVVLRGADLEGAVLAEGDEVEVVHFVGGG